MCFQCSLGTRGRTSLRCNLLHLFLGSADSKVSSRPGVREGEMAFTGWRSCPGSGATPRSASQLPCWLHAVGHPWMRCLEPPPSGWGDVNLRVPSTKDGKMRAASSYRLAKLPALVFPDSFSASMLAARCWPPLAAMSWTSSLGLGKVNMESSQKPRTKGLTGWRSCRGCCSKTSWATRKVARVWVLGWRVLGNSGANGELRLCWCRLVVGLEEPWPDETMDMGGAKSSSNIVPSPAPSPFCATT
jgi:hypothetical protein